MVRNLFDENVDPKLQLSVWQQYDWPKSVQDILQDFTTLFPLTTFYLIFLK